MNKGWRREGQRRTKGGDAWTYRHGDCKLERPDAHNKAYDDADARGKVLDNVVGVADDEAGNEAARGLQHDGGPDDGVVALEEAVLADARAVLPHDAAEEGGDERVEAELDVAHPDAGLRGALLEQLLEVDAREAGDDGGDDGGGDADRVVHERVRGRQVVGDALVRGGAARQVRVRAGHVRGRGHAELVLGAREVVVGDAVEEERVDGRAGRGERDDGDAQRQDDERDPALEAELPPQEEDAKDGSREDLSGAQNAFRQRAQHKGHQSIPRVDSTHLDLVQDLKVHGVQVLHRDVLQQVLQGVKGGRHGELPAVGREDGIVYLLEEDGGGRAGRERFGGLVYGEGEGDAELDDLVEEDGRRGEVAVVAGRRHDARVVHDLDGQLPPFTCP